MISIISLNILKRVGEKKYHTNLSNCRFRDMQILGMLEQGSLAKLGNQFLSKLPHLSFEASEECDDQHQMRKKNLGGLFGG